MRHALRILLLATATIFLSACVATVPVKVAAKTAKAGVKTAKFGVKTTAKAAALAIPDGDEKDKKEDEENN